MDPGADIPRPRFSVRTEEGYTVVTLSGNLDLAGAPVLREQFHGVLGPRTNVLVVDLSDVSGCDSSGLAVLVGTGRRARLFGGVQRLAAPSPPVAAVLHSTGLNRGLDIFPTVAAAVIGASELKGRADRGVG